MLLLVTIITIGIYYFSEEMDMLHVYVLGVLYAVFILYTIGAADYLNGGNTFLAKPHPVHLSNSCANPEASVNFYKRLQMV